MVIVGVDPVLVGRCAGVVGEVGVGVGPFLGEGAVETLDLPVGLGSIGTRELVGDVIAERLGERSRSIAGTIVGEDPFHGDAVILEERVRPRPEPGGGVFLLIAEDLGVGEPGVVIDGMVEERVPAPLLLVVAAPDRAAELSVAATIGDAPLLLDIDVDEIAWSGMFVADGFLPSHGEPRGLIKPGELRHPIPNQHLLDRGAGNPQVVTDSVWSPLPSEPQRHDSMLEPARGPIRRPVWS